MGKKVLYDLTLSSKKIQCVQIEPNQIISINMLVLIWMSKVVYVYLVYQKFEFDLTFVKVIF
jgi:hypothetical protein